MSLERFKSASADELADDLTSFLYARDHSFATAKTDVSSQTVKRETLVEVDDDGDDILVPSLKERFDVVGYRNIYIPDRKRAMPSDFVISHRQTTFIDEVPGQLRHVLEPSLLDQYDQTEPGDLNEIHGVDYAVTIEPDGLVYIGRDIRYQLRDLREVIYKARESKSPKTQKVYVASEGDTLKIRTANLPEAIEDPGLQALVGIDFCILTLDQTTDIEQNWIDVEIPFQIACINALMNSLITGRPLKQVA